MHRYIQLSKVNKHRGEKLLKQGIKDIKQDSIKVQGNTLVKNPSIGSARLNAIVQGNHVIHSNVLIFPQDTSFRFS